MTYIQLYEIDKTMSEIFRNKTCCKNCGIWNFTASSDDEKSGWTFCVNCGHVFPIENQMTWN